MGLTPNRSAMWGVVLALPFFLLDMIVAGKIEPIFSLIRPGERTSAEEIFLLLLSLAFMLLGGVITLLPVLHKDGKSHALNIILGGGLIALFIILASMLGNEIYRCDMLQIPNCG